MDNLVSRVTVVRRDGDKNRPKSQEVYVHSGKKRAKVSFWTAPLERGARRLLNAQITFGQEALRKHQESSRRRPDGWLFDAPVNLVESGRKSFNEVRKAVPFRFVPKV